jgi:hypothetical protein
VKLRSAVIIVLSGCGLLAYSGTRLARSWSGLESIAREWPANAQAPRRIVARREPAMRNTSDAPPAPLDVGATGSGAVAGAESMFPAAEQQVPNESREADIALPAVPGDDELRAAFRAALTEDADVGALLDAVDPEIRAGVSDFLQQNP